MDRARSTTAPEYTRKYASLLPEIAPPNNPCRSSAISARPKPFAKPSDTAFRPAASNPFARCPYSFVSHENAVVFVLEIAALSANEKLALISKLYVSRATARTACATRVCVEPIATTRPGAAETPTPRIESAAALIKSSRSWLDKSGQSASSMAKPRFRDLASHFRARPSIAKAKALTIALRSRGFFGLRTAAFSRSDNRSDSISSNREIRSSVSVGSAATTDFASSTPPSKRPINRPTSTRIPVDAAVERPIPTASAFDKSSQPGHRTTCPPTIQHQPCAGIEPAPHAFTMFLISEESLPTRRNGGNAKIADDSDGTADPITTRPRQASVRRRRIPPKTSFPLASHGSREHHRPSSTTQGSSLPSSRPVA